MNTFVKKLLVLTALSFPLLPVQNTVNAQNGNYIDESIYENLPFDMPKVEQPAFPDYTVNIIDFGAKGDGIEYQGHQRCYQSGKCKRRW